MSENVSIRCGLIGCMGKMGQEIRDYFTTFGDRFVLEVDKGFINESDRPDVIIDFSNPVALDSTIELCKEYNSPLVIGTTGLNEENLARLKDLSKNVAVVQSYNFADGINIIREILEIFGRYFDNWDGAIVEIHHNQKKDAPSGTAIMLKNSLGRELTISSLRVGGVFGEHTIIFSNAGEVVRISHTALSRRAFAIGVRKAALFAIQAGKGFYSYRDVLRNSGNHCE